LKRGSIRFQSSCVLLTPYLPVRPKSWDLDMTDWIEDQFGAYQGNDNQLCRPVAAEPVGCVAADVFLFTV